MALAQVNNISGLNTAGITTNHRFCGIAIIACRENTATS